MSIADRPANRAQLAKLARLAAELEAEAPAVQTHAEVDRAIRRLTAKRAARHEAERQHEPRPAPRRRPRPPVPLWTPDLRGGPRGDGPRALPLPAPNHDGQPASPVRVRTFEPGHELPELSTVADLRGDTR